MIHKINNNFLIDSCPGCLTLQIEVQFLLVILKKEIHQMLHTYTVNCKKFDLVIIMQVEFQISLIDENKT